MTALTALLLVYFAWQLERWGPPSRRALVGDTFFYPVSLAAVGTAVAAAWRTWGSRRIRRAWLLIAAAALAYLVGDVAQTVYEVQGHRPYPSLADVCYLAFYPLMLAGLLSFPTAARERSHRIRMALDLAVVALGGSGIVVYVVLGPTAIGASGSLAQVACSIAYPVGDMILLLGLSALLLRGSAPSARRSLLLMGAGLAFFVAADLVYGYITLHSVYHGGDAVDTLWMVAISVMAVGAAAQRAIDGPEQLAVRQSGASWLPYSAIALGFGVLLFSDRHDPLFPGLTMTFIAMALVALVSTRQFLGHRDLLGAQGELEYQALHDALTGLPNRLLVLDRVDHVLSRSKRSGQPVAMLFIDLDGFKQVNDTLGHAAGDELLVIVAERLQRVVRVGDTVGRLGGDEFVILLDPEPLAVPPELVAERVLCVLRQPIELHGAGRSLGVTASIGVAVDGVGTAQELLRDADIALYRAKDAGRDRFVVFETGMHAEVEDRLWLEMDLLQAIEEGQLFLDYQPTVDLQSETVTGVEALVRWQHPERGVVPPGMFIPAAEQSGLVVPLGRWVLGEACRQAALWQQRGYAIRIAVNVSARQLDDPHFVDDVDAALQETGLEPGSLILEITETTLMRDAQGAAERLQRLKALGVRLAIDDFGTGYSSLAYLRQFPVDAIKIDRSFVASLTDSEQSAALVHTLVQLGKTLGLETLGEGIETPEQLAKLQDEECDFGQGFLLARPIDPTQIERLIARGPARPAARGSVLPRLLIGD